MSGRGRGRGRPAESGGLLLLRRSAEECGLDSRNIRTLGDIATHPPLYPDIELQYLTPEDPTTSAAKRHSVQTIYLISKSREIQHRITNSVFYVRPTKDVPDVLRYSDLSMRSRDKRLRTEPIENSSDANFVLAHCLGGRQETEMGRFVPEELVTSGKQKALASRRAANALLAITNDDAAAAWEERFGPDDHVDDEGVKASRERSDSTGSAIQVDKVVAAAGEDELDDLGEEEEDEELEDVSIFILLLLEIACLYRC